MEVLGWLIVGAVLCGITLICVILTAVDDIKDGFSDYTDNELSLRAKRFTVYPLVYVALLIFFWVLMSIAGVFGFFSKIFALIAIFWFYGALVFLFPASLYGLVLAVGVKKRKINKYAGPTYLVCGIISILISLLIIGVTVWLTLKLV